MPPPAVVSPSASAKAQQLDAMEARVRQYVEEVAEEKQQLEALVSGLEVWGGGGA